MKKYWQLFAVKIDSRNQRERTLIFVMALVVVVSMLNALLIDPLLARKKRLAQEVSLQETQLQEVRGQIQVIVTSGRSDPDAPARARLAALELKKAQTNATLQSVQQSLVAPDSMARLLEDVLSQNRNLKLIALKTLPTSGVLDTPPDSNKQVAQPASTKPEEPAKPAGPGIYKHGVEITVAGSYADLTQYLDALENLSWQMYWGKAEMRVEEYPRVTLTITLYTLSMEKTWLSV